MKNSVIDQFAPSIFRATIRPSANSNNSGGVKGVVEISSFVRSICGLLVLLCAGVLSGAELPSLSINDVSVTEGNHGAVVAVFTVTLSESAEEDVTVHYKTVDDSAKAGADYLASSGIAAIAAGKTSAQIIVQVRSNQVENEERKFTIQLSDARGAAIAGATGTGVIVDDDSMNGAARQ